MKKEEIYSFIVPVLLGEDTPEERGRFEKWLNGSRENRELFSEYKRIWQEVGHLGEYGRFDPERGFHRLMEENNLRKVRKRRSRRLVAAVSGTAAALLVVLGIGHFSDIFPAEDNLVRITAPRGDQTEALLPDGSSVWLNAESSIAYKTSFGRKMRQLDLTGEAFFDVRSGSKPFIVNAIGQLQIRVHGTRFNVMAYPDEEVIETTLEEGRISLLLPGEQGSERYMEPGQWAVFHSGKERFEYRMVNTDLYTGWIHKKIILRNESLLQLVNRLERWFDADIKIDESLAAEECHFSGIFEKESLEEIMDAIARAGDLQYRISGRDVEIFREGAK
ncbi:MAG: FecR domain-containing protein [Bacteroidota bacterium]